MLENGPLPTIHTYQPRFMSNDIPKPLASCIATKVSFSLAAATHWRHKWCILWAAVIAWHGFDRLLLHHFVLCSRITHLLFSALAVHSPCCSFPLLFIPLATNEARFKRPIPHRLSSLLHHTLLHGWQRDGVAQPLFSAVFVSTNTIAFGRFGQKISFSRS